MDDFVRAEEQEIVERWIDFIKMKKLTFTRTEFAKLEKKACLLEVHPGSGESPV